ADGQINNFNTRGPLAARELKRVDEEFKERVAPVRKAVKDLLATARLVRTATKEAERKYALLKSGGMSYKAYVKLLNKARKAHKSTQAAANTFTNAAKEAKIRLGSSLGDKAISTRGLLQYCEAYAAKMAAVDEAFADL